jgi:putative ATPase
MDLFSMSSEQKKEQLAPLAWRMRPRTLDDVLGQERVIGPGSPLRRAVERDQMHSCVLYGPPGTGKLPLPVLLPA